MKTISNETSLSDNFTRVVKLVNQLPYQEKIRLGEVIREETKNMKGEDEIVTHFASENVLAKEWLTPKEDEAWKDL